MCYAKEFRTGIEIYLDFCFISAYNLNEPFGLKQAILNPLHHLQTERVVSRLPERTRLAVMLQTTRIRSHVAIKHPFQLAVCIQEQQEKVKRGHRPVPVKHSAQEHGWALSFEPRFSFFAG